MKNELEKIFSGLGVSAGVAIGVVYIHDPGAVSVPEYRLPASRIDSEKKRFNEAVENASKEIDVLIGRARLMPGSAAEEMSFLLDAYHQMLKGSRLLRGVERRIAQDRINAEAAVQKEVAQIIEGFAAFEDAYLQARMEDIRELGIRLIRALTRQQYRPFANLPKNAVIIAQNLTPADTALLEPKLVLGLASEFGGAAGHTAIMARSLNLPSVLGVPGVFDAARNGDTVIIDGKKGLVIIAPSAKSLAFYKKEREALLKERRKLCELRILPAQTKDGVKISLAANLELPSEVEAVLEEGAEGIGLLRSEFMFMNRDTLPDEEIQYQILRDIVIRLNGAPITVRTLDAGWDKLPELGHYSPSTNPALGLRAIRLCLARKELLEAQLAAILRASVHGNVRILLPMISSVAEVKEVRAIMEEVAMRLRGEGKNIPDKLPPLGVMIEIPGAALTADSIARHSDFLAIGSNDLTMYTLAIDRSDEHVAHLYDPLHPAVLRLIQFTTEAALRNRIPISICGEIAGDPKFTPLLLGLGIRELSMAASNIPLVKQKIRSIDIVAVSNMVREVMYYEDTEKIREKLAGV